MTMRELFLETAPAGRKEVSNEELSKFWDRQEDLSKSTVNEILEKRKAALSSETKIVLG